MIRRVNTIKLNGYSARLNNYCRLLITFRFLFSLFADLSYFINFILFYFNLFAKNKLSDCFKLKGKRNTEHNLFSCNLITFTKYLITRSYRHGRGVYISEIVKITKFLKITIC